MPRLSFTSPPGSQTSRGASSPASLPPASPCSPRPSRRASQNAPPDQGPALTHRTTPGIPWLMRDLPGPGRVAKSTPLLQAQPGHPVRSRGHIVPWSPAPNAWHSPPVPSAPPPLTSATEPIGLVTALSDATLLWNQNSLLSSG